MKRLVVLCIAGCLLTPAAIAFNWIENFGTGPDASLAGLSWTITAGAITVTEAAGVRNGWAGRAVDRQTITSGVINKSYRAVPGLTAPNTGLWQFSMDISAPASTSYNSRMGLSFGTNQRVDWWSLGSYWRFDARGLTGGSSDYWDTPVDSGFFDNPIIATIWVDFDGGITLGSISDGVTTYTSATYTIDPARTFDSTHIILDRRSTWAGFDTDNLSLKVYCSGFEGDISGPEGLPDCRVDFYDFAALAAEWLACYDPNTANCL